MELSNIGDMLSALPIEKCEELLKYIRDNYPNSEFVKMLDYYFQG